MKQRITGRPLELHRGGDGSFVKPGELIDVVEMSPLTLNDRRIFNLLLLNAWDRIGEKRQHVIAKSVLRGAHESGDRLGDSLKRLMSAIVEVAILRDGRPISIERVQLLGYNKEDQVGGPSDLLCYRFPDELIDLIRESDVWGRLQAQVMLHLSSKYSLALYEMISKRSRLQHITFEDFGLDRLRGLLGVPPGKMTRFPDFRRYVLEPAVAEVAALSDCYIKAEPIRSGARTVTGYRLHWWPKDDAGLKATYTELERHKVGRRARIANTVDMALPSMPAAVFDDSMDDL